MKSFDKKNGWQIYCVGGPMDGMVIRASPTECLAPGDRPMESFPLTAHPDGLYVLSEVVGKTAKYRGEMFPKLQYLWTEQTQDDVELTA